MREEQFQSFPHPNEQNTYYIYIKTELEKAGIEVQRISIDNTITTDKEVPEDIKSHIHAYASDKGIAVKFKTPE
jgi:hypothetical protein